MQEYPGNFPTSLSVCGVGILELRYANGSIDLILPIIQVDLDLRKMFKLEKVNTRKRILGPECSKLL